MSNNDITGLEQFNKDMEIAISLPREPGWSKPFFAKKVCFKTPESDNEHDEFVKAMPTIPDLNVRFESRWGIIWISQEWKLPSGQIIPGYYKLTGYNDVRYWIEP